MFVFQPTPTTYSAIKSLISYCGCLFLLTACSAENSSFEDTRLNAQTSAVIELSPELSQTFVQTCALCHTRANTGAPLAGDTQTWKKILAKGIGPSLEHTLHGYGGMPPGGQCFDCTLEELVQLIAFMSQQQIQGQP